MISYDISDNRRRREVEKCLQRYGNRVQKAFLNVCCTLINSLHYGRAFPGSYPWMKIVCVTIPSVQGVKIAFAGKVLEMPLTTQIVIFSDHVYLACCQL